MDVGGRSRWLSLNCRTTEGIRQAALKEVEALDLDVLEGDAEHNADAMPTCRSQRAGVPPVRMGFDTPSAEADRLARIAAEEAGALRIPTRTEAGQEAPQERLLERGTEARLLGEATAALDAGADAMCALHPSKGFEAPRVIHSGARQVPMPWPGGGDEAQKRM